MAIKTIEISGYRSIAHIILNADNITAFIGRNGSGKSNILSALNYFYRNLTGIYDEANIFDATNSLRNEICISVTYDMEQIMRIIQHNMSQAEKKRKEDSEDYEEEYSAYYRKIRSLVRNDEVVVRLTRRKAGTVVWNVDYSVRQIIEAIFPAYFIDARNIELTDWTMLWELIGDFIKVKNEKTQELRQEIKDKAKSDPTTARKLGKLEQIFKDKQITLQSLTAKQFGKILAETALGGQLFQYEERNLREYSNGTNAYNYTNLMIAILGEMKQYKLKEPVIILDEPEISLHQVMVDRMMENIFAMSGKVQFLMSTHSPRCMKMMLEREETDFGIYHVVLKDRYTRLAKVKNLAEEETRERAVITEAYTNSCFARMVVSVEGETELEVLKNKYLRLIFPELREPEFVMGMSNAVIQNLASPGSRNYQVPALSVADMDKVLKKVQGKNRFIFEDIRRDGQKDREPYWYGRKRADTLMVKRRILGMCGKCNFTYQYPFYSCDDNNFRCLLTLIKKYYENYDIFLWDTTIEGALITGRNSEQFLHFMTRYLEKQRVSSAVRSKIGLYCQKYESRPNIRLNYLRMIFSGKCDYLLTKRQLQNENEKIYPDLLDTMMIIRKTENWISCWLETYFLELAGISESDTAPFRKFSDWLEKEDNYRHVVSRFGADFEELYSFLSRIKMTLSEKDGRLNVSRQ